MLFRPTQIIQVSYHFWKVVKSVLANHAVVLRELVLPPSQKPNAWEGSKIREIGFCSLKFSSTEKIQLKYSNVSNCVSVHKYAF